MSNFNEYISKLDCAITIKYNIEQLSFALERMKDEYKFWLYHKSGLPRHLMELPSSNLSCLKYEALDKHEERVAQKEAP